MSKLQSRILEQLAARGGDWWRTLTAAGLRADLLAGLLGALLVLPQGVAFARLAGLPPEYGIYTAVVPCIVAALFGSSRHVVSGPTNANSLALFAMLSPLAIPGTPDYLRLVLTATFMVGVMQFLIARFRFGSLANFISPSVLSGFMSGAACLIAYHAAVDLWHLAWPAGRFAWIEPGVALVTVAATVAASRFRPRWPAMLLGLAAGHALAEGWQWQSGQAVARLGALKSAIPPLSMPDLSPATLAQLAGIALSLTIVALGQSISIAKAMAERSGQHIDVNREFLGQGLSNIAGSFFSSYLSCGSLNRSLPNLEAGAQTPLAAVFSSVLLLALVLASADLLAGIPMSAVTALLLYVAWTLINVRRITGIVRFSRQEAVCLGATWVAMLLIPIEFAILIGVGLSLLFYLHHTSRPVMRVLVPHGPERRFTPVEEVTGAVAECPQLKLVRMEGDVYFGATQHVGNVLREFRERHPGQKHLLVMAKSMNFVDMAGELLWSREFRLRAGTGGGLYFHRPRPRVVDAWRRSGLHQELLGGRHIFASKADALAHIVPTLDPDICARCTARIFLECAKMPGGAGRG
ncbi:SulP family inorganic anion transporter [Aromatoleum petrolei]|uniref:SulP family inorganic anion transporter n=1 Tax=Aromatoleum petrolei TaxID=76116 RepID=UPI001AEBE99C|nr:SulP family inorganic anion transporter [Aromatoleum petrolei]QTQ38759.1 Sulfate permease family protein [Aromatoleum petrolei]